MPGLARRAAARMFPGLVAWMDRVESTADRLDGLQRVVDRLDRDVSGSSDDRLTRLRRLVSRVESYQPLYGVSGIIEHPARPSRDRAELIAAALGHLPGRRVLDIGSSLGYFTYYLADHGARTTGWEMNPDNVEVARLVGEINGVPATFTTTALDESTAAALRPDHYDAVLALAVLHHVIRFQGLEAAQRIVASLLAASPVLVLELAVKGEDPDLPWDAAQPDDTLAVLDLVRDDVTVTLLGMFPTHLSDVHRPLYLVSRRSTVSVGSKVFAYDDVRGEAYVRSPAGRLPIDRRYYAGADVIVKEYKFSDDHPDNWTQVIGELYFHSRLSSERPIHHQMVLDAWELTPEGARLALRKLPGDLLTNIAPISQEQAVGVARDVLRTLADMRRSGLHHNDVRSWNILVDGTSAWLIDYGRVGEEVESDAIALAWALTAGLAGVRELEQDHKTTLPDLGPLVDGPLAGLAQALLDGERDPAQLLGLVPDVNHGAEPR